MDLDFKNVLVTGASGFIGFHVSLRLLNSGYSVTGVDNMNAYYDVNLKKARLKRLKGFHGFTFYEADISDRPKLEAIFNRHAFDIVVNLAAQAGVRYSIENPYAYVDSNLVGFMNILENCRHHAIQHLVFASSSSVYGANTRMPFSVHHNVDHPVSLYAATKKANELMAHTYAHLYDLPCTGLRFFTVYGPWGRPDMALFLFTRAIFEGRPIDEFDNGSISVEPKRNSGTEHLIITLGQSHLDVFRVSSDQGLEWESQIIYPDECLNVSQIAFAPTDTHVLYAASRTGLWRSTNLGQTWSRAEGELGYVNIVSLAVVKEGDRAILYVTTPGGYAARTDRGMLTTADDSIRDVTTLVNPGVYRFTQLPPKNYYLPIILQ